MMRLVHLAILYRLSALPELGGRDSRDACASAFTSTFR